MQRGVIVLLLLMMASIYRVGPISRRAVRRGVPHESGRLVVVGQANVVYLIVVTCCALLLLGHGGGRTLITCAEQIGSRWLCVKRRLWHLAVGAHRVDRLIVTIIVRTGHRLLLMLMGLVAGRSAVEVDRGAELVDR